MDKGFNILEALFHEKILLYQELVESLKKERTLLIKTDMDGLWDISEKKQDTVTRIESVRSKIDATLAGLAAEANVSSLRIDAVISMIPAPKRERFRQVYLSLVQLKTETRQRSAENKAIVEQSLDFLDEIITLIADDGNKRQGYTNEGSFDQKGPSNLLISREV